MSGDKVFVSGNLKFDAGTMPLARPLAHELQQRFGSPSRPLLLAASTHAPEEQILIEAFSKLQSNDPKPRLLIAPRHPERFAEVASLIAATGLSWTRRTAAPSAQDREHDLILLDTIGELPAAYSLATIVFVGGSLSQTGGHNILEPAALESCIVTGAHTHNFAAVVKTFVQADALIQLPPLEEASAASTLAQLFSELLNDRSRREQLGRRAKLMVEENVGATERTMQLIAPLLQGKTSGILKAEILTDRMRSA
jgi:3-deoxy-D-manno-octulosonic-acid transferase